jgi:hypothetical protein
MLLSPSGKSVRVIIEQPKVIGSFTIGLACFGPSNDHGTVLVSYPMARAETLHLQYRRVMLPLSILG